MPRTCLGTCVVTLGKNIHRRHPSVLPVHDDSGGNRGGRAALLVEYCEDDEKSYLDLKLSTGTRSYGWTLAPADAATADIVRRISGNDQSDDDRGDEHGSREPSASEMLEMGRCLFLRHRDDGEENRYRNLVAVFQYEPGTASSDGTIDGDRDRDRSPEEKSDLCVLVQENLVNGIKRTLHRQTLEALECNDDDDDDDDESDRRVDGLAFCRAVGNALNRTLERARQLEAGRRHWKRTAEDLGRIQQETKDTLLANFTRLRNKLVASHQAELAKLREDHAEKLRTLEASLKKSAESARRAANRSRKKEEAEAMIVDKKELLPYEDALALAEGRRLDGRTGGGGGKMGAVPQREAILKPEDVVDMVQLRREAEEYKRNREKKRQQRQDDRKQDAAAVSSAAVSGRTGASANRSNAEKADGNYDHHRRTSTGRERRGKRQRTMTASATDGGPEPKFSPDRVRSRRPADEDGAMTTTTTTTTTIAAAAPTAVRERRPPHQEAKRRRHHHRHDDDDEPRPSEIRAVDRTEVPGSPKAARVARRKASAAADTEPVPAGPATPAGGNSDAPSPREAAADDDDDDDGNESTASPDSGWTLARKKSPALGTAPKGSVPPFRRKPSASPPPATTRDDDDDGSTASSESSWTLQR